MTGELTAEKLDQNTNLSDNAIKELSGLTGGASAIITGNAVGLSDQEIADNIFGGQRIGKRESGGLWGNHMKYDVNPYYEYGNAPNPIDPTNKQQREDRKWLYFK